MSGASRSYELLGSQIPLDRKVTLADLFQFKNQIVSEIRKIISDQAQPKVKKWLKSAEVKKLLDISYGTLHTLRAKGVLPYTEIGGVLYYDYDDINRLLSGKNTLQK